MREEKVEYPAISSHKQENTIDISALILADEGVQYATPIKRHIKNNNDQHKRENRKFIKGPVYLDWIQAAGKIGGNALKVAIALSFQNGFNKNKGEVIQLSNKLMATFGMSKSEKAKALRALCKAGLISLDQNPGRKAEIIVLDESPLDIL